MTTGPFLIVDWSGFCDLPELRVLLVDLGLVGSRSDADRLIRQGAVRLSDRIEGDPRYLLNALDVRPNPIPGVVGYDGPWWVRVQAGRKRRGIILTQGVQPAT